MRLCGGVLALMIVLFPVGSATAQEAPTELRVIQPADLEWQPAPPSLEPGAVGAVLSGDPSQSAPFTLRIRLPANYRIAPHHHSVSERLTVISGTLCFATAGAEATTSDSTCIGPGTFRLMPAGMVHSDWTTEPVEFQIDAFGPFDITYVNPREDPREGNQGSR